MKPTWGGDRAIYNRDSIVLVCPSPKEWTARRVDGAVRTPHPGTAVIWDGETYEVMDAGRVGERFHYRLVAWNERHVIRRIVEYDRATQAQEQQAHQRVVSAEKYRRVSFLILPFYGLLPADIQERIESSIGVLAYRQTLVSSLAFLLVGAIGVAASVLAFTGLMLPLPSLLQLLSVYFFGESAIRLMSVLGNSRPIGCALIALPYHLVKIARSRPEPRPQDSLTIDPVVAARDRFQLLEPFAALLPAEDQLVLRERFEFDPFLWGPRTAFVLLLAASGGIASALVRLTSPTADWKFFTFLSLLLALFFVGEQLHRFMQFSKRQPTGSILGSLIRPFSLDLLVPGSRHDDDADAVC